MTVATTASRKSFSGNGVTTAFAYPYEYRSSADLKVVVVSSANVATLKTLTTHYTVSGVSDSHGGYSSATVTMLTAPASGETLIIYRKPSIVQGTNVESEADPEYALNNSLDYVTYVLQHLANDKLSLPIGVTESFSATLPDLPDDDAVTYYLGPSSDRTSLSWLTGIAASSSVSSAWLPVVTAATLALGRVAGSIASLGQNVFSYLTGALTTAAEDYVQTSRNSSYTGNNIYDAIYPSVSNFDAVQGVTSIADGSTITQANGVSGYVRVSDASTNGVGLFGAGIITIDSGKAWGINTLLMDAATRATGSATGRVLTNEFDFNVMNTGTVINGLSLGGNSLAQPTTANAFICNPLGTGILWTTAFYSLDGAATNGVALGATATSGTNVASQPLLLQYFNAASTKKTATISATSTAINVSNNDTDLTFAVSGYVNVPSSKGYSINSTLILDSSHLYLPAGGILNFNSGNVTVTHSTGALTVSGAFKSSSASAGIGYATGAGGTVTQGTSKATGVTLDKICGAVTTHNAALAAAAEVSFTLTNSTIAATDVVVACIKSGATAGAYAVTVDAVAAGSCQISLSNLSAGSLSEAIVINFVVIKAVAA